MERASQSRTLIALIVIALLLAGLIFPSAHHGGIEFALTVVSSSLLPDRASSERYAPADDPRVFRDSILTIAGRAPPAGV
jgi:hypothetical protein